MRTDEVDVTPFELESIIDRGATVTKTGAEGFRYLLHRDGERPADQFGMHPVRVTAFMAQELREGGRTGLSCSDDLPVLSLGIHLRD